MSFGCASSGENTDPYFIKHRAVRKHAGWEVKRTTTYNEVLLSLVFGRLVFYFSLSKEELKTLK